MAFGQDYQSSLVVALVLNNMGEATAILQHGGVDLKHRDHSGRCPLDYCLQNPDRDYNCYQEESEGSKYTGDCGKAKLLLDHGADVNLQDRAGWTVCHQCASVGHLPLLQLFVRRGADVTIKNNDGHCPLDIAVLKGHTPLIRYLEIQSGCLSSLCRRAIRESMQKRCPFRLNELPLPASLRLFVNYHIPYPGWAASLIVPRPWTEEEVRSGTVAREKVQSFIEENASEAFLDERQVRGRELKEEDLAELMEALYFWEAFKMVDYSEPLAPPPRYSMECTSLTKLPFLETLKSLKIK